MANTDHNQAYYSSKEYRIKKYAAMTQEERNTIRAKWEKLKRFHSNLFDDRQASRYKRELALLDEAEKASATRV